MLALTNAIDKTPLALVPKRIVSIEDISEAEIPGLPECRLQPRCRIYVDAGGHWGPTSFYVGESYRYVFDALECEEMRGAR